MLKLAPVSPHSAGFPVLMAESEHEGHRMLARFEGNWRSGHRFDRPGEVILGAWRGDRLVGICGRNIDPYDAGPRAGRVRHLYVSAGERRRGTGRQLLGTVISGASAWFDFLNTNAPREAFAFYVRLGFAPHPTAHTTHRLML